MLPENNFINKPTLNNPKKLDPNRIKMLGNLGGQKIIGQLIKNPNEYQKKILILKNVIKIINVNNFRSK